MEVCKTLVRRYEKEIEQVVEERIKEVSTICEDLPWPLDRVDLAVQLAEAIFRNRADIKIESTVHQLDTPSPRGALYVDTGAGMFGEELTEAGFYFQSVIRDMLWEHSALFALRIGAPSPPSWWTGWERPQGPDARPVPLPNTSASRADRCWCRRKPRW